MSNGIVRIEFKTDNAVFAEYRLLTIADILKGIASGQAGKWSDVYANLPFETAPVNIANNDRSLTFWVTVVPKSDLPYITGGN